VSCLPSTIEDYTGYYLTMEPADYVVRDATIDDATSCASIYGPYVTGTAVTFETEPPEPGEMANRIAEALASHAWVVLADRGERGPAPGHGLRTGRHLPADRLEARSLARRGLGPAAHRCEDGPTH